MDFVFLAIAIIRYMFVLSNYYRLEDHFSNSKQFAHAEIVTLDY